MDLVLRSTTMAMEEQRIKWGSKAHLDLGYADDLSDSQCLSPPCGKYPL